MRLQVLDENTIEWFFFFFFEADRRHRSHGQLNHESGAAAVQVQGGLLSYHLTNTLPSYLPSWMFPHVRTLLNTVRYTFGPFWRPSGSIWLPLFNYFMSSSILIICCALPFYRPTVFFSITLQVNLGFYGHNHVVQRHSALLNKKVTEGFCLWVYICRLADRDTDRVIGIEIFRMYI